MIKRKKHPYYNFAKLFSFNALIMLLCGGRGLGKTFGFKKKAIRDFLRKGEQFIYLRRTVEELKEAKSTFFADIEKEFPDQEFKVEGKYAMTRRYLEQKDDEDAVAYAKRQKGNKWQVMGFFVALSVAQQTKSTAYPLVTVIGFDEFIIEKSAQTQYLRSEVEALMNFYNTVDRFQDKTRLLMMSNSVSIMNPYFTAWGIEPDNLPEWSTHSEGDIVAHFPDAEAYQNSVFQTRFGKFITRTMPDYADYAVSNTFRDAHDALVAEKTKDAKYKYSLETERGTFAVWYDMKTGLYYVLSKLPGNQRILTLLVDSMDHGKIRVTYTEPVLRTLRYAFDRGKVVFEKPQTRNAFAPVFERK